MRENSLPGLSTRGAVFRSRILWNTVVKLLAYAKDLGVSNLADYGTCFAGALVVEAHMNRSSNPVASQRGLEAVERGRLVRGRQPGDQHSGPLDAAARDGTMQ
jgi:hypothetical protein